MKNHTEYGIFTKTLKSSSFSISRPVLKLSELNSLHAIRGKNSGDLTPQMWDALWYINRSTLRFSEANLSEV